MGAQRLFTGQVLRWLAATAAAAADHVSAGLAGRQFHHRGNGLSGAGGVVGTASRHWLSLYIAALCALFFDYFFLPPVHTFWLAGAQAWVAMLSFVAELRGGEPAWRSGRGARRCRPSSARRMWSGCTR